MRSGIKKFGFLYSIALLALAGCGSGNKGELTGVLHREKWYQADPYGMVYIPAGSYNMGPSDQDVNYSLTAQSKTVTIPAFYMDHTEITNNEYRQFVYWVRDSLAHRLIGGEHLIEEGEYGERINWKAKIKWDDEQNEETLAELFLPETERFYRRKEIDTRKLNFEYYWIDLKAAAQRENREQGMRDRSVFIKKDVINVYPDTLAWIHDYAYSYHEPLTKMYFWHPAYDDYPVVGVNWKQARAFCIWRTQLLNSYLADEGGAFVQDYRLPTESEWEYAARGGLELSPYPWGGPYIRNSRGCFLGNFKPMRGSYQDDGGVYTVKATSYWPNDYGLYCMAGNVSEWTSNAYDESAYSFTHDISTDYEYDAKDSDPPALKRKVIRGGSWKDVMYFLQTGTRSYEYQDTSKCYVGFRCVMSFLGRDKSDY
ncbi:MAG: SUMF1/EgtB/PvdO family nonheme iron enzyme [Bacteroidota bacterium]|jgi:gliding motility-associated lipoprotein GldK|uniref:type IX secretion system lipoprotein PorK/GldK n=1 Tax=Candidatus Pollutiaquabacter sp. TaxID=3416354 RepID=UPI001A4363C1|nr:SUMF1/EgtB/PvdO family nonheme iron enzyme [Bacteroidota bacterium]MBL7949284.1 SUMF1/EgtB/PvdO family nonheme iron enzyme [Bacteroidia bacterium]MBP7269990.1 SUMF1/EgtB/PvdO family nonheme iron enzyme [Bacteroidia bacterium]MBP7436221.1 SUMF1/EgtB/PvdO family nonheme iron enzyme [Bacteroidia bacterium]MBP7728918.1 SUMF1/EgtB/PvdO family nonheme iron enzyme [Bacteroidia bacterium]